MNPKTFEIAFLKAKNAARRGDRAEAHRLFFALQQADPNNGRVRKALEDLGPISASAPSRVESVKLTEAIKAAKAAAVPAFDPLQEINRIVELCGASRYAEAVAAGEALLARRVNSPVLLGVLGPAYTSLGRYQDAERVLRAVLSVVPNVAELHSALGDTLRSQGRHSEAVESFRQAVALKPDFAKARHNLGNALKAQGLVGEAEAELRAAIELDPSVALAHYGLGDALELMGRLDEALACYDQALTIDPNQNAARAAAYNKRMQMCDWSRLEEFASQAPTLGVGEGVPVPTLGLMALEDIPERHRARAELLVRVDFPAVERKVFAAPKARPQRLRLGYFSSDLRDNHPVMTLVSGLFRCHDKTRFEVTCFTNSDGTGCAELYAALKDEVDRMVDIRSLSDPQALELTRSHGIDIAIDLNGHTLGSRTKLFAHGLAPVQINYLGYPGTIGAAFMDYLVADHVVVPPRERKHYTESLLLMPHSYMPADNQRYVPLQPFHDRRHYGLPEDGFVFCCFNNNFKMTPREFDVWMRLLNAIPGSVAWLLGANRWARANLLREAEARGVEPGRLVFTERVEKDEHLARHRHADLFLDTFNYNAHTTACEALWTGLPVLTLEGRSFPARVAASLLTAVGMPELITHSVEEYEALALTLATDRGRLAQMRLRLNGQLATSPLFNTEEYTRSLEAGYDLTYQRFLDGQKPADISIK